MKQNKIMNHFGMIQISFDLYDNISSISQMPWIFIGQLDRCSQINIAGGAFTSRYFAATPTFFTAAILYDYRYFPFLTHLY